MPGALFTVNEVAAALRLSPSTVYRALQDGRVRGVRVREAGTIRIPADELARLLDAPAEVEP